MGFGRAAGPRQARAGGSPLWERPRRAVRIPAAVSRAVVWGVQVPAECDLSGFGPAAVTRAAEKIMTSKFRIGLTPDFYTDAKGKFESVIEEELRKVDGVESEPMPPQPGKLATPGALNQFDAIFSLALKITPESLRGVDRLAAVARWGVGYDMIDVDALTEADIVLSITSNAVRRPVA